MSEAPSPALARRSLQRDLLLPMISMGVLIGATSAWLRYVDYSTRLRDLVRQRAETFAHAVNYSAETVNRLGALRRIVMAFGADRDLELIVVAGGEPPTVLASTQNALIGRPVADLSLAEGGAELRATLATQQPRWLDNSEVYEFSVPLILNTTQYVDGSLEGAVATVRLDAAPIRRQLSAAARGIVGWAVAAVLGTTGLGFLLVRTLVLKPVGSITATMARRAAGDLEAYAPVPSPNEIGSLAATLNDLIDTVVEREARIKAIVESSHDGILLLDADGIVQDANPAAERMFELPGAALVGQRLANLLVPGRSQQTFEVERVRCGAAGESETAKRPLELMALRHSGEEFHMELALAPIKIARGMLSVFARDTTVRRRLEVELRHAQKLEAVGQLAAGIAHEINTPIQFVSDNCTFMRDALKGIRGLLASYREIHTALASDAMAPDAATVKIAEAEQQSDIGYLMENIPAAIDQSLEGLNRVATIVRSMKQFAHPDQRDKTPANINEAVMSTLTIARNEYKYVADLKTEFDDLPPVPCFPGDLNQAVLNLVVNAAHAIADVVNGTDARGEIVVRTWQENGEACISIRDTGGGIPEDVRNRIFDPFFTTKAVGRGTGQGLAIARAVVVDKHGGTIDVETAIGRGSTFTIRLPLEPSGDAAAA